MHELRRNLMLNRVDGRVCLHEYGVSEAVASASMEYSVCGSITGSSCIHEHGGKSTQRQARRTDHPPVPHHLALSVSIYLF